MRKTCLMMVAGERSGDMYGALLVNALQTRLQNVEIFGCGGELMRCAGVETIADIHEVALIGISEVVYGLPKAYGAMRRLADEAARRKPAAAILIDSPSFNLSLAKRLKRRGISVIYYVSPQIWAWKPWRLRKIKANVDRMLCLFDFEEQIYRKAGVPVDYVGHPLVDLARPHGTREQFLAAAGLDPNLPTVALLPGSRKTEVSFNLPTILDAARRLSASRKIQFIVAAAPSLHPHLIESIVTSRCNGDATVRTVFDQTAEALEHADVAIVASGTATIEAALRERPMVVVYRVSRFTAACARVMIRVPFYSMVNLLAGRAVVPELIQSDFEAGAVAAQIEQLLDGSERRVSMIEDLRKVKARLGQGGASGRAADAIVRHLGAVAPVSPPAGSFCNGDL